MGRLPKIKSSQRPVISRLFPLFALLLCAVSVPALCQLASPPPEAANQQQPPEAPSPALPPSPAPPLIPAQTPIMLRLDADVSSKTAKRGDKFPLTLVSDIVIEGQTVVPAGTPGMGEVIHAAGKGFGGRAGELILAARYLDVQGARLKLQSFRINRAGANNTAEALVATNVVPLAGLLVTGTSAEVTAGQTASAKTAEAFTLDQPKSLQPPTPTSPETES